MSKLIKEEVTNLLKEYPTMRDDDRTLIINVWARDLERHFIDPSQFRTFFKFYKAGILTGVETIRRTRQIIQEKNPGLRGKEYHKHKELEQQWNEEISNH